MVHFQFSSVSQTNAFCVKETFNDALKLVSWYISGGLTKATFLSRWNIVSKPNTPSFVAALRFNSTRCKSFALRLLKESDFDNETNLRTLYPSVFRKLSKIQRKREECVCPLWVDCKLTRCVDSGDRREEQHWARCMQHDDASWTEHICGVSDKTFQSFPCSLPVFRLRNNSYKSNYIATMFKNGNRCLYV